MKGLILDGGRFLGMSLAELSLSEEQAFRICEPASYDASQLPSHQLIEWYLGDYSRVTNISPALAKIDTVFLHQPRRQKRLTTVLEIAYYLITNSESGSLQ